MEQEPAKQWRPLNKLRIERESAFLGPGSRQLLTFIEETGSVRLACQKMNMSYSKAWKMIFIKNLNVIIKSAGLISDFQFGFRKKHWTIEYIPRIVNTVNEEVEGKRHIDVGSISGHNTAFDKA